MGTYMHVCRGSQAVKAEFPGSTVTLSRAALLQFKQRVTVPVDHASVVPVSEAVPVPVPVPVPASVPVSALPVEARVVAVATAALAGAQDGSEWRRGGVLYSE